MYESSMEIYCSSQGADKWRGKKTVGEDSSSKEQDSFDFGNLGEDSSVERAGHSDSGISAKIHEQEMGDGFILGNLGEDSLPKESTSFHIRGISAKIH